MADYNEAVKKFEGFTPRASWDYKQHSNGYGTKAAFPGEVIDRPTAEQRFGVEMGKARAHVDSFAPDAPEGVKAALASLTYNAGPGWSQSGLGAAVKAGDYEGAKQRFLQYNKAGGEVNDGLTARRAQEAAWFDHTPTAQTQPAESTPMSNAFGQTQIVPNQRYPLPGAIPQPPDPGALSADSIAGPGSLYGKPDSFFNQDSLSGIEKAGVYLSGIGNPAALGALAATAAKPGRYSVQRDEKTGKIYTIDNQTGRSTVTNIPGWDPNHDANQEYDKDQAKSFSKLNDEISSTATAANQHLNTVSQLKTLLSDPNVYQGAGGDHVQNLKKLGQAVGFTVDGTTNADVAKSLISQMTTQARNNNGGMPGSLSDKDLAFLKTMAPSLDNTPGANSQILGNLSSIHQRALDVERMRQEHVASGGRVNEAFKKKVADFANANPLFANIPVTQSPATATPQLPKGVRSIQIVQ